MGSGDLALKFNKVPYFKFRGKFLHEYIYISDLLSLLWLWFTHSSPLGKSCIIHNLYALLETN